MKTVPFTMGGQTYHLLLNGAALFDLYEQFGDQDSLLNHLDGRGRQSFENTCVFLAKLGEQGELLRRYLGHDPGPVPTEELFRVGLSPRDAARAKSAVIEAVCAGFEREEGGKQKQVDKGLLELQKKTAAGSAGRSI